MNDVNVVYSGECLELMNRIESKSIDLILCDLPYGTTQNKWDAIIPFPALWQQYERIIKDNGAIVLTAQTPFDKVLGCSNLPLLRYEWIWHKDNATGFMNSKKMPLKATENVLVFYKSLPVYNPQMRTGFKPYATKGSYSKSVNYGKIGGKDWQSQSDGERYPINYLYFPIDQTIRLHPTQKPVALFEYFIKTYTNEGATVLDNCAGSGTTGAACINTNRNYILIEKEEKYIDVINNRLAACMVKKATQQHGDLFSIR